MAWYHYRQNNSGGRFFVEDGISVNVYVEADNAAAADYRAQSIGLYFDGVYEGLDCECCGDRWYSASEYDVVPVSEVPEPDEMMVIDRDRFDMKRVPVGYETWVHPLSGAPYGAHKETSEVNVPVYGGENGYGVAVWFTEYLGPFAVNKRGWAEDGNRHAPSPGASDIGTKPTEVGSTIRFDSGRSFWSFWFKYEEDALAFTKNLDDYFEKTPMFDPVQYLPASEVE